jgi:DNA-binding sugar fermentation-stimulating protein
VQRDDVEFVGESNLDKKYREACKEARKAGIEFRAFGFSIKPEGIFFHKELRTIV